MSKLNSSEHYRPGLVEKTEQLVNQLECFLETDWLGQQLSNYHAEDMPARLQASRLACPPVGASEHEHLSFVSEGNNPGAVFVSREFRINDEKLLRADLQVWNPTGNQAHEDKLSLFMNRHFDPDSRLLLKQDWALLIDRCQVDDPIQLLRVESINSKHRQLENWLTIYSDNQPLLTLVEVRQSFDSQANQILEAYLEVYGSGHPRWSDSRINLKPSNGQAGWFVSELDAVALVNLDLAVEVLLPQISAKMAVLTDCLQNLKPKPGSVQIIA